MFDGLTLQQLQCFDAIVREQSFQLAADKLHRSQPTVSVAVRNLEQQLGLSLLDRTGYRVALTDAGRSLHDRVAKLLEALQQLKEQAGTLAKGEESELRVVIGDLCPLPEILGLLRRFFDTFPGTRLHLHFEALSGPWERLFDDEADLIVHHIDKSDARLEFTDLFAVDLIPVVAPGFLRFPVSTEISPDQMRDYVQCIIRDTARHSKPRDYFVLEGARSWTVSDQLMKRELILQGMGWGHMPLYLIDEDLKQGRLLSIAGNHLRGGRAELVVARRGTAPHGPIANRLWAYFREEAVVFGAPRPAP